MCGEGAALCAPGPPAAGLQSSLTIAEPAKAEALPQPLSEFLSFAVFRLKSRVVVPIVGVVPGRGSQPRCCQEAGPGQTLPRQRCLGGPHLSDAGGEVGPMVAEPHPLLCLVALQRTGLMAEEEVVPRWLLANWATALTVNVLASMLFCA